MTRSEADEEYLHLKERTKAGTLLWHYTDWNGLRGMLEKKEIWATHSRCLNDTKEIIGTLGLVAEELSRHSELVQLWTARFASTDQENPLPIYFASLSKAFDSLGQWREYSGQSIGFALGFDREHLREVAENYEFQLMDCEYDLEDGAKPKAKARLLTEEWQRTKDEQERVQDDETASDQHKHNVLRRWTDKQRTVPGEFVAEMARFKHECFEYEKEVRLVSQAIAPFDYRKLHSEVKVDFRLRGNLEVPYLRMPLRMPEVSLETLAVLPTPLRAVLLGPTACQKGLNAVRKLLVSLDMAASVVVTRSQLPMRAR